MTDTATFRVLVVDDDPLVLRSCRWILDTPDVEATLCEDAAQALECLSQRPVDVVLTDVSMPGMDGYELLRRVKRDWPTVEVVIMTGVGDIPGAVQATKDGAHEYITKPFSVEGLQAAVRQAGRVKRLRDENEALRRELAGGVGGLLLKSSAPAMQPVLSRLNAAAKVDTPVLITGATGTGKSELAEELHRRGPRAKGPFVVVECGGLPPQLFEDAFFGTEGADGEDPHKGYFDQAAKGTLFLDQVGELPLDLQQRLVAVLESGRFRRPGSVRSAALRVRLVCANREELEPAVEAGRFREDLYFRLRVLRLHLPELSERREDIPRLAASLLPGLARAQGRPCPRMTAEFVERLREASYPGNIRELSNTLEASLLSADAEELRAEDLPPELQAQRDDHPTPGLDCELPYREAMDAITSAYAVAYLGHVLRSRGTIAAAARHAGMDRANFRRLLRRFEVTLD